MKILLWTISILAILATIPFIILLCNMIFIGTITEFKSQRGPDIKVGSDDITVEELTNFSQQVISNNDHLNDQQDTTNPYQELHLSPQGELEVAEQWASRGENKLVHRITLGDNGRQLIFDGNKVYLQSGNGLGELLHEFTSPEIEAVYYLNYVDQNTLFLVASLSEFQHVETRLWQVNTNTFDMILLSEEPYFTHIMPPKIISPKGLEGTLAVYYSGDYAFSYGGHSSRPKVSSVRLYSTAHPNGIHLGDFYYKAGTIIDVETMVGGIMLTGDPSRPLTVENRERPARFWKVSGF